MINRLRVGFVTSTPFIKTGFSNNARTLIPYLYKKDKYDIFQLHQGIDDGSPDIKRFPWKGMGAIKRGFFDEAKWNQPHEEEYRRWVSYGNAAVEKFVLDNQLDVLILQEDGWGFAPDSYFKTKWFPYLRENVLLHTTVDSWPILEIYREWATNCPNIWLWASFGVRDIKLIDPQKYGHVQHVFGSITTDEYKPISLEEKLELRKKFNIDEDTVMFLKLGRAQLRKLFPAALEAFAKFKKLYPSYKAKLHFHCFAGEGWPFARLIKDFGINNEDVLFTYYCRTCNQWEIKPLAGEHLDCRFCGQKGMHPCPQWPGGLGQITAGVGSTITNKDIAKIYGISDASLSIYTSGGLEMHNPQSLLCGLPLLCTEYSSGEDFVCNDFVYKLDGSCTFEQGTGFKKHVPNINTIVNYFKTICDMSVEERKTIGQKGREWALKTFDISQIGPVFEKWLDERKKINWDYKYPPEPLKNPDATIYPIENEVEYILTLYKNILNMADKKESDEDVAGWVKNIKAGQKREDIEKYFRQVAWQKNEEINKQLNNTNKDFGDLLIKNGKKQLLIVCKESWGDCLYSIGLFKSFRQKYPREEWNIYLGTDRQYFEIFDGQEDIDRLLEFQSFFDSEVACTGTGTSPGYFDAYCHLTVATQKHLNYLTNNNINLELEERVA